jgi:protease-4
MKDFLKSVLATITGIVVLGIIMAIISVISMVGLVASSAGSTKVAENSVFTLML